MFLSTDINAADEAYDDDDNAVDEKPSMTPGLW